MVKKCAGACMGAESHQKHMTRLRMALEQVRVRDWPYPGAIAIIEGSGALREFLVVRNWCFLGKAYGIDAARRLDRVAAAFDADSYKILCGPVLRGETQIVCLGESDDIIA